MISFTSYRTKLLPESKANAFAAALRGNPRFAHVAVERSSRAKGSACWFVRYASSSEVRRRALVDGAQDARTRRAMDQEFTFCSDPERAGYHCLSHSSSEVYEVTLNSCSCPDQEARCRAAGIACKHRVALHLAITAGTVADLARVTPRAFEQKRFAEIFG